GDVNEIESWIRCDGKIGTRCDWILRDDVNDEVIGRGTSLHHQRASKIPASRVVVGHQEDGLRVEDEVEVGCLKFYYDVLTTLCCGLVATRLAFPEPNNSSLKKIAKLEGPTENSRLGFVPRRSDRDRNKHVSNVTYIGWALEIIDTRELQAITIDYRRECQQSDVVDLLSSREPLDDTVVSELKNGNGSSALQNDRQDMIRFLHLLRSSDNGLEISRCRTEWRMKIARK
nr:oleoyl-acyl carrier protein thioesterase [Tanacetum cinerariifolium]